MALVISVLSLVAFDNVDTEDPMAIIYHLWMNVLLCTYQFTAKIGR